MVKLNQVIAIEKGAKASGYSMLTGLNKVAQKGGELFNGFYKKYTKKDEEGEDLPPEAKRVQNTVAEMIADAMRSQTDSWYQTARKEWTNCTAKANIVVDGVNLDGTGADGVPVTFLLQLEKHLIDLRTFIGNLPTLDPNEEWKLDDNSGMYKTAAISTHRSKKVQKAIVLYDATTDHPAQTQLITEDVLAGNWETTKVSGAIPATVKKGYLDKVERLIRAVKMAREEANSITVVDTPHIEEALLNFVFKP